MRPLQGTNKEYDEAWRNAKKIDGSSHSVKVQEGSEKRQEVGEQVGKFLAWKQYGDPISDVENEEEMEDWKLDFLRINDPDSWWLEVIRLPTTYDSVGVNRKRCPGCGDGALLVGPNFRIPKKKDTKAWRKIESMIESGEDMLAKFSPCPTSDQHKEMVVEAIRLFKRASVSAQWEEEKKCRIAEVRPSLEQSV